MVASPALAVTLQELNQLRLPAAALSLQQLMRGRLAGSEGRVMNQAGRGLEFREVRAYQPGDDPRYLDWKVTARRGQAFTRTFEAEHQRPVALFVEQTSQLQFGSLASKAVMAARLAALFGWAALHEGEKVGGWIETDQGGWWEAPARGSRYFIRWLARLAACNQELGELQPAPPNQLDLALAAMRQRLPAASLVILISDFRSCQQDALLRWMAQKHALVLVHLTDPLDQQLPTHLGPVTAAGERWHLSREQTDLWQASFVQRQQWLRAALGSRGRYIEISTRDESRWLQQLLPGYNRKLQQEQVDYSHPLGTGTSNA